MVEAAAASGGPAAAGTVTPIVELVNAIKTFGEQKAVDDLTLQGGGGQIVGLIGPSGCGKTTVIRLILGVLAATHGTVCVMGVDSRALTSRPRERIGYTPQGFFLYPTLTVYENVRFVARLFGLRFRRQRQRTREVLEFLELWEARKRLARDRSGGMKRRLALASWRSVRSSNCASRRSAARSSTSRSRPSPGRICRRCGRCWACAPRAGMEGDVLRLVVDAAATLTPTIVTELQNRGVNVAAVTPYEASFDEVFMRIVAKNV